MYQYIFFDLDGTLTDPGMGITNSVAYALDHQNIRVEDRTELYRFIGPPLVESFMEYYGFTREEAEEELRLYREYFAPKGIFENEMYPGVPDLLAKLKADGKTLILATSKPDQFSLRILEHFGLDKYFDFCACATMDEKRNTKPDVIRYGLESMQITDIGSCLMIGDREQDITGAKANGMDSLGVLYGYGSREELENAGATYIAESVEEILKFI